MFLQSIKKRCHLNVNYQCNTYTIFEKMWFRKTYYFIKGRSYRSHLIVSIVEKLFHKKSHIAFLHVEKKTFQCVICHKYLFSESNAGASEASRKWVGTKIFNLRIFQTELCCHCGMKKLEILEGWKILPNEWQGVFKMSNKHISNEKVWSCDLMRCLNQN